MLNRPATAAAAASLERDVRCAASTTIPSWYAETPVPLRRGRLPMRRGRSGARRSMHNAWIGRRLFKSALPPEVFVRCECLTSRRLQMPWAASAVYRWESPTADGPVMAACRPFISVRFRATVVRTVRRLPCS